MVNREYNVAGKQDYNITIDGVLFNRIEKYKQSKRYKNSAQAVSEILKFGLDYIEEQEEDEYLLALALEREKNGSGKTYSFEEHLAKRGLTIEDIDNMEDVELEYELPHQI